VLENLTVDSFSGRVGDRFELATDGGTHELTLDECTRLGGAAIEREPFSLVFLGPRDPLLPQQIYALSHPDLGTLELFLVPIAQDENGTRYEAIFT
jgi:hypothetical protein